ncbi:MAG: hypothetical protein AB7I19_20670 [Planctomycetota bacterium]
MIRSPRPTPPDPSARLLRREQDLLAELEAALERHEAALRASWLICLCDEVQDPAARAECERAAAEVERCERELVGLRTLLRPGGDAAA